MWEVDVAIDQVQGLATFNMLCAVGLITFLWLLIMAMGDSK